MSDRDRLAAVLAPYLGAGWVSPLAIADALIAAGVTMPAAEREPVPTLCHCGESAESTGWGVCEKHWDADD